ncbi:MAG: hypothetical protein AAGJ40_18860 [Planctomycetota bacterium]
MKMLITCLVGFIAMVGMDAKIANGQGIQDLFASPPSSSQEARNRFDRKDIDGILGTTARRPQRDAAADARAVLGIASPSDRGLVATSGSLEARRHAAAMQIRQTRAMKAYAERVARLEAARWSGNPTLRPSWNPDPFTASRYPNHHKLIVPAYIVR